MCKNKDKVSVRVSFVKLMGALKVKFNYFFIPFTKVLINQAFSNQQSADFIGVLAP